MIKAFIEGNNDWGLATCQDPRARAIRLAVMAEHGIAEVENRAEADVHVLQVVGNDVLHSGYLDELDRPRTILLVIEPPQFADPIFAYTDHPAARGWASVLSLANRKVFPPNNLGTCMHHVRVDRRPASPSDRRICTLASYRVAPPGATSLTDMTVFTNGSREARPAQILSATRCRLALDLRARDPGCIDIYGPGWPSDVAVKEDSRFSAGGWHQRKMQLLQNYAFNLCFENSSFPGYVTEKFWDCAIAGIMPIYLGSPDFHLTAPPDSFIDGRLFMSSQGLVDAAALLDHVNGMSDADYARRVGRLTDWFDGLPEDTHVMSARAPMEILAREIRTV